MARFFSLRQPTNAGVVHNIFSRRIICVKNFYELAVVKSIRANEKDNASHILQNVIQINRFRTQRLLVNNAVQIYELVITVILQHIIGKSSHEAILLTNHGRRAVCTDASQVLQINVRVDASFLNCQNMSSPRVQVMSVSMESRSSHNSNVGDRERMNMSSCAI